MTIPYTFAGATTAIPLANLDANFASPITLGNVAMTLSNTYNSIGNLTLTNVTISSASGLAANTVAYANASGVLGGSANMTFDGSTLTTLNSAYTGTLTGGTGIVNLGSGQFYKDASGNVGIGVVPSSISSSYKSIELGAVGNEWSSTSGTNNFSTNAIRGTSWTYGSTNKAFLYQQDVSGGHLWFYAPSGTAGTAITFTQAMTLDNSGNLLVGLTSGTSSKLSANQTIGAYDSSLNKIEIQCATGTGYINMTGTGNIAIRTGSSFTQVALINGSTGVYTPTSDINKKKDFEPSTLGLSAILQLKPTLFRMKTDNESSQKTLGFIAQEVKDVIPQAYVENQTENVDGNSESFIGLQDRPIVAVLVKAIQELNAKVDALEAQLGVK